MSSEIRILRGIFEGKTIRTLRGKRYRPTMEQGRISLFNSLGDKVIDSYFLDLFSGSGIIGFEALSLGARKVVFVENYIPAVRLLRDNAKNLGVEEKVEIFSQDVFSFLKREFHEEFNMVFMDPPYSYGKRIDEILNLLEENLWIKEKGVVIIEHHKKVKIQNKFKFLELYDIKKFGETYFSYYIRKNENV
ncbi:MAG: 16S rRNA (guanine(966)-N(2))-methyltransferase RsmD [Dictyoglomaceae bacterium]|nr:16S rRNA (guanine(966)-N(2))-methyltransferase RsmD [Dictyoglomaceae bacterium]